MWPQALALWLGTLHPRGGVVLVLVGAFAAGLGTRLRSVAHGAPLLVLGLALAGAGLSGSRVRLAEQALLARLAAERGVVEIEARAVSDARATAGGHWQLAAVERADGRPVRERLLIRWSRGDDPPRWGERFRAVGDLRPLGRDGFAGYVRLRHAVASFAVREHDPTGPAPFAWRAAHTVRTRAAAAYTRGLDERRAALLAGLVLGIPPPEEVAAPFAAAGLSHLLVVSGQHAAVVTALAVTGGGIAGLGFRMRRVAALVALGWLVLLVRPQPSVLRAAACVVLLLGAQLAGRMVDAVRTLAVVVAILLLADPFLGAQLGFQLSVAAVTGLLWWARRAAAPRRGRWWSLLAAAAAAQLAVTPLLWWRLGAVPLLAVPANAAAIPLATAAQAAGAAAAGAAQWSEGAGAVLARVAGPPLGALGRLAELFARGPVLPAPKVAAPGLVPEPVRGLLPGTLPAQVDALALHALDVDQGDALLIEVPGEGAAARMLVDAGPDPSLALRRLRRLGVQRLDAVVLSHGDLDHSGGMEAVLEGIRIGALILGPHPPLVAGTPAARAIDAARRRGVPVLRVHAGHWVRLGSAHVEVLGPPREGFPGEPANEHSPGATGARSRRANPAHGRQRGARAGMAAAPARATARGGAEGAASRRQHQRRRIPGGGRRQSRRAVGGCGQQLRAPPPRRARGAARR